MNYRERIKKDRLRFRKEGDLTGSSILGVVLGEIDTAEKRSGQELTDGEVSKIIKKLMEACEQTGDNREADLLYTYLPQQLEYEELSVVIRQFIDDNPGTNIGQVMKYLKANFDGQYDGKAASGIAKQYL